MSSTQHVLDDVSAVAQIADAALRSSVVRTYEEMLDRSAFVDLRETPQGINVPNRSLLDHTNETAMMASWLRSWAAERFDMETDADVVLAASVLHDIDKLIIYQRTGDRVEFAGGYTSSDHGPVGATFAAGQGVPDEVCDIVRYHSPLGDHHLLPDTPEATILRHADLCTADLAALQMGRYPMHKRLRVIPGA